MHYSLSGQSNQISNQKHRISNLSINPKRRKESEPEQEEKDGGKPCPRPPSRSTTSPHLPLRSSATFIAASATPSSRYLPLPPRPASPPLALLLNFSTLRRAGERPLQQPLQDRHSEMRPLHQPTLRQHAGAASAGGQPAPPQRHLLDPRPHKSPGTQRNVPPSSLSLLHFMPPRIFMTFFCVLDGPGRVFMPSNPVAAGAARSTERGHGASQGDAGDQSDTPREQT